MIYLVCFGISTILAYSANKTKKRSTFILLSILSILVTVTLAGLRDYSIGIDTSNYYTFPRFWTGALKYDTLWGYMTYYISQGFLEPGFALFLGIIEHTTGNFSVFLFAAHAVIVTGVYIGAFRMRRCARPELILLLFYLLYYNSSLNLIRQYMAMAIVFAFFADIERHCYARYIFGVMIAFFVHNTVLLALVPLVVHMALNFRKPLHSVSVLQLTLFCILILIAVTFFLPFVKWLLQVGILPAKYSFYFQGGRRLSITRTVLHVLEIMGIIFCFSALKNNNNNVDFYILNSVIMMLLYRVGTGIKYGDRLALYFVFPNLITVAMLPASQGKREHRIIQYCVIVGLCVYMWYYLYVGALSSETYPYASILSGKQ